MSINALKNPTRCITFIMAAFFPAFVVTMIAFFNGEETYPRLGIAATVIGAALTIVAVKHVARQRVKIEIDEKGIREIAGSVKTEIQWHENHTVFYDAVEYWGVPVPIPMGSRIRTRVTADDGREIKLEITKPDFHKQILILSEQALKPKMEENLRLGKELSFGPVTLAQNKLTINGKEYSRSQIKKVDVKRGLFRFKLEGDWLRTKIRVKEIPNFTCLHNLLSL